MNVVPLQVIDSFLLGYNVGDALLLVTVLGVLGTLVVKRSLRLLSVHLIMMGALFVVLPSNMLVPNPQSLLPTMASYKAAGLVLVAISPVIFTVSRK